MDRHNKLINQYRAFSVTKWKEEDDVVDGIGKVLFLFLGICCITGWISEIFQFSSSLLFLFLGALLLVLIYEGIYLLSVHHKMIDWCILGFSILLFVLPFPLNGLKGILYDGSKVMARRGIRLFFQGKQVDSIFDKGFAALLLLSILYVLLRKAYEHKMILLLLVLFVMFLVEIRYGNGGSAVWYAITNLWFLMCIASSVRSYFLVGIPLLLVTLAMVFLVREDCGWRQIWDTVRYHENVQSLPEGNLNLATSSQKGDKTALTIEGDISGYYYLKGFVGTVYTRNQWTNDDNTLDDFESGIVAGTNDFLSWLHKKGFSGLNELASKVKKEEQHFITIHNENASRKYLYLPYELLTSVQDLEDDRIGVTSSGETMKAVGIFGQKKYLLKMSPSLAGEEISPSTADGSKPDEYDAYEEYVYRTCLSLPKEMKETLTQLLEGSNSIGRGDTMATVTRVRKWLEQNMTYNDHPQQLNDDEDFTKYLFDGEAEGYDVQYATAAVMLFRYYGIPSRYVEGYLVEDTNLITEKAAHAWPEIFLSGKGWVPVEVMDSYRQRMPSYLPENGEEIKTLNNKDLENDKESEIKQEEEKQEDAPVNQNQSEKNTEEKTKEDKGKTSDNSHGNGTLKGWMIPVCILFLLIIVGIIFVLILLLRENNTKRRYLHSSTRRIRIISYYKYCIWFLYLLEGDLVEKRKMEADNRVCQWETWWMKYHAKVSRMDLVRAELVRQKAIYGPQDLTKEEFQANIQFFQKEYAYFYGALSWSDKWKVRLGYRPKFLKKSFPL